VARVEEKKWRKMKSRERRLEGKEGGVLCQRLSYL